MDGTWTLAITNEEQRPKSSCSMLVFWIWEWTSNCSCSFSRCLLCKVWALKLCNLKRWLTDHIFADETLYCGRYLRTWFQMSLRTFDMDSLTLMPTVNSECVPLRLCVNISECQRGVLLAFTITSQRIVFWRKCNETKASQSAHVPWKHVGF